MHNNYTVGFFVQTPFHYYLYETIIDELVKRNVHCHLVLNDYLAYSNEWKDMHYGLVEFIEQLERTDIDAFLLSTIKEHEFVYDCFVSPFYTNEIRDLGKLHVRLMYGLAKENWTYAWWNVFYDKIFCYGDYDYNKLNICNNCIKIGNPKFDRWFQNKLPSKHELIKADKLNIDSSKETILYAPTYGNLSSIDRWLDKIKKLEENYNIIVKLHHGTVFLSSEKNRRQKIYTQFENICDDRVNILHLLKVSDYVLTDYSGIIFDALLASKPVILLNIEVNSNFTDSRSLEIKIRSQIEEVNDEMELCDVLQNKKYEEQKYIDINEYYFIDPNENAGAKAADEIIKLLNHSDDILDNKFLLSLREQLFK